MALVKCEIAQRPTHGALFDCITPCKECGEPFRWNEKRAHVGAFPLTCGCNKLIFPTTDRIDPTKEVSYTSRMEVEWHKSVSQ